MPGSVASECPPSTRSMAPCAAASAAAQRASQPSALRAPTGPVGESPPVRSDTSRPGSFQPQSESTAMWTAPAAAVFDSQPASTLDAQGSPIRSTTSGIISPAKPSSRNKASAAPTTWGPARRQPEGGSASTGQPSSAPRALRGAASSLGHRPTTMMPRAPARRWSASSPRSDAALPPISCQALCSVRAGGSSPGSPRSGSRNGRLRWTGPGPTGPLAASARARLANDRHMGRAASSGTPRSENQRTARPKRCTWSMVCGAPTSCASGGRSAVQTMSGTPAWCASTTEACSSTAAVPLVVSTTVGRPLPSASPTAKKPAPRSSNRTLTRRPP